MELLMKERIHSWFTELRRKAVEKKKLAKQNRTIQRWEKKGRPVPTPDIVKHTTLISYARKYSLKAFVETGTLHGDTVEAVKGVFDRIVSIELSETLFEKASARFRSDKNVTIIQGDSGKLLGSIAGSLKQPALFWLDGHYSAGETARGENDTPILDELRHVLASAETRHVMIIDDAHCFGADPAYPSLDELKRFVLSQRKGLSISVQDDSIRIEPA
jgi:hypothetical protein